MQLPTSSTALAFALVLGGACRSTPPPELDDLQAGAAAYERGERELALEHYARALAERPDDPQLLDLQGETLLELGRLQEALESLDRSLELDPANPCAHAHRGQVLLVMGKPEQAIPAFELAIVLAPDVEHFQQYLERARAAQER